MRYADGCEIILDGTSEHKDNMPLIEGPKGKVFSPFRTTIDNLEQKLASFPDPEPMITDFTESVKTRRPFALNENNGFRSATLINLAKIAMRAPGPLRFDPVKLRFINNDEANRLVDQPMRAPWIM
jgi:hypothetical protein